MAFKTSSGIEENYTTQGETTYRSFGILWNPQSCPSLLPQGTHIVLFSVDTSEPFSLDHILFSS
jgi:hypothetical protein